MKITIIFCLFIISFAAIGEQMKIKFSDTTIPYITEYEKLSVKNSFNNELTRLLNTLKCNLVQQKNPKTFWENYTRIGLVEYDIVSIKIRSNYNCDGIHPQNDVDHSITYDLENNRLVTLFDIFQSKDINYQIIRDSFYKSITKLECTEKIKFYLESEKLFKEYLKYYLEKDGIIFKLVVPYGIRFCVSDVKLPYDIVINQMAYTGILTKLEAKYKKKKEDD